MMSFDLVNVKRQTKNRRALWNSDIGHVSDKRLSAVVLRYYTSSITPLILHCPQSTGPTNSISPSDLGKIILHRIRSYKSFNASHFAYVNIFETRDFFIVLRFVSTKLRIRSKKAHKNEEIH